MTSKIPKTSLWCAIVAITALTALAPPASAQVYPVAVCIEVIPGIATGRTNPTFIAHWGYLNQNAKTTVIPKGTLTKNYFSPGYTTYQGQTMVFGPGFRTESLIVFNSDQTSTSAQDFSSVSWHLDGKVASASLPVVGSDGAVSFPTPVCSIEVTPVPVTVAGAGTYLSKKIATITGDAGSQGITLTVLGAPDDGGISLSNLTYTPTTFIRGGGPVTTGSISADIQVNRVTAQTTVFNLQMAAAGVSPTTQTVQVPISIDPAHTCAIDQTANVALTLGGFSQNLMTHVYTQTVRVQNTTAATIEGPVVLALDNLAANATLTNATGTTGCSYPAGSPVLPVASSLAPGQTAAITLTFSNSSTGQSITYTPRVLAGGTQQ